MAHIEDGLVYQEDDARKLIERLRRRFTPVHERIETRKLYYGNDPQVDPKIGPYTRDGKPAPNNPFAALPAYQTHKLRKVAQDAASRLMENPAVIVGEVAKPTADETKARDFAAILNAWKSQIEEETRQPWQPVMSQHQMRFPFTVMHTRRLESRRQAIDVKAHRGTLPSGEREDDYLYDETEQEYTEKAEAHGKRKAGEYADNGVPWTVEFFEPLHVIPWFGRPPEAPLKGLVLVYEVDAIEYETLSQAPNEATAMSSISTEVPAPGIEKPVGGVAIDSAMRAEFERRVTVCCLWTKDEYYELCDHGGQGGSQKIELVKAFKHDYGEVPFYIVYANRNYDSDPLLDSDPYLEDLFRLAPFLNYMMTLAGGVAELQANPITYRQDSSSTMSQLEDGSFEEQSTDSLAGEKIPEGQDIKAINTQVTTGLSAMLQFLTEQMNDATPATGQVDIGAYTAPWTARIWLSAANVPLRPLINEQAAAIKWWANFVRRWHIRHPEEPVVGYGQDYKRSLPGRPVKYDRSKVIEVKPEDLRGIDMDCEINPLSGGEMMATAEHIAGFVRMGFMRDVDLFEKGFGERDPWSYRIALEGDQTAKPLRLTYARAKLLEQFGHRIHFGPNGEVFDGFGNPVDPMQALAKQGYTPAGPMGGNPGVHQIPEAGGKTGQSQTEDNTGLMGPGANGSVATPPATAGQLGNQTSIQDLQVPGQVRLPG